MKAGSHAVVPPHGHDCAVCGAQLDRAHLENGPDGVRCAFCGAPQTEESPRPDLRLLPADGAADDDLGSLRNARVARGETLEQAAHFTNISLSYLRRLESGDIASFEPFPGHVYARFFVRDYAEHLSVDPEPLLRRIDREAAPAPEPTPTLLPIPQRTVRRRRWAIGALVVLVSLLAADARLHQASDRPTFPPAAGRHASPITDRPGSHHPAPAPTQGIDVVLHTTARCWVDVTVDGKDALQRTLPAGRTVRVRGDREVDLRLGNAGAVTLEVNGRPVPTGAPGEVVDLTFAWHDGRLVRS